MKALIHLSLLKTSFWGALLGLLLALSSQPCSGGITQTSIVGGLSLYPQSTTGLINQLGYFLYFQVEQRERWIRPIYAGQIEASFGTNRMITGQMYGGVQIIASNAAYIKPFLSAQGLLGWVSYTDSSSNYVGPIYGFLLGAGVEIRFSEKDQATAIRLGSQWRYPIGTIGGGLTGSDLNAVQLYFGVAF